MRARVSRLLGTGLLALLFAVWIGDRAISGQAASPDGLWQPVDAPAAFRPFAADASRTQPSRVRAFRMDTRQLDTILAAVRRALDEGAPRITLPLPDGRYVQFRIHETEVMAPELAASLGGFRTFRAVGTEDPTIVARLEYGPEGLRAVIMSPEGRFYVEPTKDAPELPYVAFQAERPAQPRQPTPRNGPPRCLLTSAQASDDRKRDVAFRLGRARPAEAEVPGSVFRVYRLAMAATGEYTRVQGGTIASASRAIASTVNRINEVYEADLGVSFRLIARNSELVQTDPATDPYTNNSAPALLRENQEQLDTKIGSDGYDIGHVLSTGAGGLARLDAACGAGIKAQGATGKADPTGDPFDIDYVAHEIGHQMGGNHTFNGSTGSCGGGNRNAGTAFEPGSGSTVMAYAGICGDADLQPNSNPYFHAGSLDEIREFLTTGGGSTCGTRTPTTNTPPVVSADLTAFAIPKATPFRLTGHATDASATLRYVWEEMDLGPQAPPDSDADGQLRPLFRSRMPGTDSVRVFPILDGLLSGTLPTGERLPSAPRKLRFRLTARDDATPAGGFGHADVTVTVASSGPLVVTAPAVHASWRAGTTQTVKWKVNGTNAGVVNCQQVRVLLSVDGGHSYPTVLSTGTANDGSEPLPIPDTAAAGSDGARTMVECATSPFFAVSAPFTITPSSSTRAARSQP